MTQTTASAHELGSASIRAHWEGVDAGLARLFSIMDSKEDWTAGDDEFVGLLAQLVDMCDQEGFALSLETGDSAAKLSAIFALLCTSRFARVLVMIDRKAPGLIGRLILRMNSLGGEVAVFVELFYERLLVIKGCNLMGHIFNGERAARISESIGAIAAARSDQ
jgi:hypothetical protein